jgi:cobalamin biosynthesis protein CobT
MKIKIKRSEVKIIEGSIAEELFSGLKVEEDRDSFIRRLRREMDGEKSSDFVREEEMIEGLNEEISSASSFDDPTDFLLVVGDRWKANPVLFPFDREVKIRSEFEVSEEEFRRLKLSSQLRPNSIKAVPIGETIKELEQMSKNTSRQLGARLRRVLFSRSLGRTQYDQEAGRLNSRALSQMFTSPSFTRLYKTKTEGQKVDTHVEILVDLSGSMRKDSKIELASASCLTLGDALSPLKGLGLSFGISGFTTAPPLEPSTLRREVSKVQTSAFGESLGECYDRKNEPLEHSVWVEPSDDWRRARSRLAYMSTGYLLRNNADGEALRWVGERLSRIKSDRKILIVISDGEPALECSKPQTLIPKTRLEEVTLRESGIEVFGLGVGSNAVSSIYTNSATIKSAEEIEGVLVERLSTWLLSEQNKNRR